MMANKVDFKMQLPSDAELDALFNMVPKLERYKVLDKATAEAAKVVVKRARELAPRSDKTGSKKKWSNKMTTGKKDGGQGRSPNETPLWKTIKRVFRKYNNRYGLAVIGPEWPAGNKAYFNTSPKGRKEVRWGTVTGRVVAQIRNWIVQAFDQTKTEQLNAMKASVRSSIDQVMRGK